MLTLDKTRLRFIEPMLPTLVHEPPAGEKWLHEIKHDGYRTQLVLSPHERVAFTRNGFTGASVTPKSSTMLVG